MKRHLFFFFFFFANILEFFKFPRFEIKVGAESGPWCWVTGLIVHPKKTPTAVLSAMAEVIDSSVKNKTEPESIDDNDDKIVPLKIKFSLGIGECTQAIYVFIGGFYLNVFFLETACLDPTYVGVIQLIGGIWDTINDPLIGMLSDRTRTRFGRRRPWLLGAAFPAGAAYFAIWQTLGDDVEDEFKLAYYLMCYMCLSASITAIQVQITSLTPELTSDYDERTTLATYRLAIANVFALICLFIHSSIVQAYDQSDKDIGYRISAAIFAPLIVCTALFAFWNIKEKWNEAEESTDRLTLCESLKILFTNKAFIIVELVYLCGLTAVVLIQTNLLLYAKYIVNSENAITYMILMVQGVALLCLPCWLWFSKKYGKKQMYYVGGITVAFAVFFLLFLDGSDHLWAAYLISFITGACLIVVYLVPYAMLPDVIEVDEKKTGKRREGTYSGFFVVFMKTSVTLALAMSNWILGAAGFEAPESSCGLETGDLNDTQPEKVKTVIRILCGPLPAALFLAATFFVWCFPITRESHAEIAREMKHIRRKRSSMKASMELKDINVDKKNGNVTKNDVTIAIRKGGEETKEKEGVASS